MKLSILLPAAVGALCAVAQNADNCNTSSKKRNGADFILTDQGDNPNVASLSKIFADAGKKVAVADVFDAGNHYLTTDSSGKKAWEEKPDFDDQNTSKWVPQGITSTADALDVGTYEGKDGWIVSWHREDDKSARVTFVDRADDSYRHVLLVYPHAKDDFREVPLHAGGIMWYGSTLWIVDTWNGIRVFDMDNIWQVDSGDDVGKKSGGGYSAANYKYVLPQIRWYKWTPSFDFRFSWISLDRTTTPDSLMVGEYQTSTDVPIRMVQYDLDYKTRKLKADGTTAKGSWAYCVNIERMQGAVQADGKIYISQSNGKNAGSIWGWVPGQGAHENAGIVPPSPEDLSYDKRGKKIYGLTEVAGGRYILTLDSSKIKFS
ncbi:anchored cell wall 12 [Fusarium albosuccineum]|uniref:Anchored cell wall 12 n=1 Tax=Fusarium albosuccineum TaxID=1237068 RepID=A0A8H4LJ98_9HYPO|nr:anchored cell wall 12 [Fusarium albosuccineum]